MRSGRGKSAYKKPVSRMPISKEGQKKTPTGPIKQQPVPQKPAIAKAVPTPPKAKVTPGMPLRKVVSAETRGGGLESRLMAARVAEAARIAAQAKAAMAVKVIAEHTVAKDETLSHISLKYYKSAAKPYYMVIYEANKDTIGKNPNLIKAGMKLRIPELPAELKK